MSIPKQIWHPSFEQLVLPHLDAAYNLARWLTRNEQDDPHTPNPEQLTLQTDSSKLLLRGLECLPPNFREVLVLRELEGMSYKEISAVSGMPAGTVMTSLSRGHGRLRQSLEQLVNANVPATSVPFKPAHA